MWTLHFSTHKRYSGVPQIVITQVQLCQTRELWAENFRQSFTAPQWEVTATQTKKKKIHAAFIKDNIRQYLHAVQEVKVKVVADYCDLRWNTETTKMQKHENDADLIFFSVLIDYIYQLRKWECWLIWPESFHFTLWAFHSNREKLYTWILQVVVTQV